MFSSLKFFTAAILFFLMAPPVSAEASFASCEEAGAMAVKAAVYLEEHGSSAAFQVFDQKDGLFRDRDLYVFVDILSAQGLLVAFHPFYPSLVGKDLSNLRDVSGAAFVDAIAAVKGRKWIDYKYQDPSDNGRIKNKKTYVIKVGKYLLGVGCYERNGITG